MDYIDGKLKLAACALLCLVFFLGFDATADAAANAALSYQSANKSYVELFRDPSRKKYRQYWLEVINEYSTIAEKYPDSAFAPNARFKSAKLYVQLYNYAGKKSDLKKASEIYQSIARDYPRAPSPTTPCSTPERSLSRWGTRPRPRSSTGASCRSSRKETWPGRPGRG